MKTIIIPTDFSENSWNALKYGVQLFQKQDCTIYLLHVAPPNVANTDTASVNGKNRSDDKALNEKLQEQVQRTSEIETEGAHHFLPIVKRGNVLQHIRWMAAEKKAELIIMGTKGSSGLDRAIMGSNTSDVITKVKCNVLVIPECAEFSQIQDLAFATDYNLLYTNPLLLSLSNILHLTSARLSVLNITRVDQPLLENQKENREVLLNYLTESVSSEISDRTLANVNVIMAIEGFVVQRNIGLLVMAAKGLNLLQRLQFDAPDQKMRFRTEVPLWILHE